MISGIASSSGSVICSSSGWKLKPVATTERLLIFSFSHFLNGMFTLPKLCNFSLALMSSSFRVSLSRMNFAVESGEAACFFSRLSLKVQEQSKASTNCTCTSDSIPKLAVRSEHLNNNRSLVRRPKHFVVETCKK